MLLREFEYPTYELILPGDTQTEAPVTRLTDTTLGDDPQKFQQNDSLVTFEKLSTSEVRIPIINFTNHPVKAAMDEAIKWFSVCIIIEVMLGLGCSVDLNALKNHIKRPYGVGIASASQFILMPLLVFGGVKLLGISHVPAVVVLVTASVPGGILSNILAYLIEGDIALSMLMTICSSLLAFAFIPFNLFVYGSQWLPQDINYRQLIAYPAVLLSLLIMFVPVSVGIIISWRWPGFAKQITTVCKALLIATTLGLVVLTALVYEDMLLRHLPMEMWIICTVMPLFGFGFGYFLATLAPVSDQTRRTVAVETMCQNGQLGCAILKVAFPSHLIGSFFVFPLLYSAFQFVEGLLFVVIVRYKKKLELENKNFQKISSLGEVPVSRIRKVSLYVIDQWRRRFSSEDKVDNKPPAIIVDDIDVPEEMMKRPIMRSLSNNIIKMAIAEEEEPRVLVTSQLSEIESNYEFFRQVSCTSDVFKGTIFEDDERPSTSVAVTSQDSDPKIEFKNADSDVECDNILIYSTGSSIREFDFTYPECENSE